MEDPLLKTFTRAVLHCSTVAEVSEVLNGEVEPAGLDGVAVAAPTGNTTHFQYFFSQPQTLLIRLRREAGGLHRRRGTRAPCGPPR